MTRQGYTRALITTCKSKIFPIRVETNGTIAKMPQMLSLLTKNLCLKKKLQNAEILLIFR